MKKCFAAAITVMALLSGCNGDITADYPIVFPSTEEALVKDQIVYDFDIDDEGNIYIVTVEWGYGSDYRANISYDNRFYLTKYKKIPSPFGENDKDYDKGFTVALNSFSEGGMSNYDLCGGLKAAEDYYYIDAYGGERSALYLYDFSKNENNLVLNFDNSTAVEKSFFTDDLLYATSIDYAAAIENSENYRDYTRLVVVDLSNMLPQTLMQRGCIDFSVYPDGRLIVYGKDDGGFYLSVFEAGGGKEILKEYQDFGYISNLTAFGENGFLYSTADGSKTVAHIPEIEDEIVVFNHENRKPERFLIKDGKLYFVDRAINFGGVYAVDISSMV